MLQYDFYMNKSVESIPSKIPSLKLSIVILLIYLFAIVPLLAGIMYVLVSLGYPLKILKSNLSESILISQICLTTALIYYFFTRYSDYLLSVGWRANFFTYLRVGLKWSIPLVIIHIISLSVPNIREKLLENYLSMKIISVKGITNISLIIFSIGAILGAIFEEFFFRGIVVNKLKENQRRKSRYLTPKLDGSIGLFYDRNRSLLTSLLISGPKMVNARLNIYPAFVKIGWFRPGMFIGVGEIDHFLIGITFAHIPVGIVGG